MAKPGFFAWREWRHGIGRYKGKTPKDPALRPRGLRKVIPLTWWIKDLRLGSGPNPKPVPVPPKPKPKPRPGKNITMYDDVNVALIPKTAPAVAGYVGGNWPTYKSLLKLFPHAKKLSIAVSASEDARCLDVEKGDASPQQAPAWVKRQRARGEKLPVVYTSLAYAQGLVNLLNASGLRYGKDYLLWSAHYTGKRHICSPKCGLGLKVTAHATQYDDKALGRNLDVSVCSPLFFE